MNEQENYQRMEGLIPEESIPEIDNLLKNTPLDIRLKVSLWFEFVNFITEAGFRESKMWTDDEIPLQNLITKYCSSSCAKILKEIEEWEIDGKPESKQYKDSDI